VSQADRERWDIRHSELGPIDGEGPPPPPPAFAHVEHLFPTRGRALEIACGRGRGVVWLAHRGLEVWAVDVSPVAIDLARGLARRLGVAERCHLEVRDLDQGLPDGPPVDLLLCYLFRDERLDRPMMERLAPGGLLAVAVLSEVGVGPGRFRVSPGELQRAFGGLAVLEEGEADGLAWILARAAGSPE
jgi:SAM-dependent methyltransferase